ncbi:putative aflatoxin biosynthesis ketoreductase nor-1 [Lophiostoma macrostomum CBS 122681]|uniref:Putative aflatoxin biosynthesis ketoreductase nor-1 n=1 Tax=Lophiostoma macrostomum CBS 122681 TaxID=1314788 RepID=A0A6A6TCQ4_9PLEO|nr:putative aflatoxin biosynthesis ketoreductase nor-1 [Lophiostoma macrostomum CBS 122681]
MSDAPIVTLITGPNRGIGRGILSTILARPNNVVIAAVRDPQATVSQSLKELPKGEGSSLHIVKIDNGVHTDPAAAVKDIEAAGISYMDTVVANAATGDAASSVLETKVEDVRRHLDINTVSVLALFQATEPFLRKNKSGNPKFIALSSNLGSIGLAPYVPGPWYCYGVTKAALNYTIRRIHVENDWLTATSLQPGWVQTDMGQFAATLVGMDSAPMKLEDSVAGCVTVIDTASKEKYNGEFVDSELNQVLW